MKSRVYSKVSIQASVVLGNLIKLARKQRQWTEQELADRAGISRTTLQKIEKGDLACEIGLVFEVAVLVGVKLFEDENTNLSSVQARIENTLTLLPKTTRKKLENLDDEF